MSREVVTSGRQVGYDQIGLGLAVAVLALAGAALLTRGASGSAPNSRPPPRGRPWQGCTGAETEPNPSAGSSGSGVTVTAGRNLNRAAGFLAFSVLADSAIEHYRGSFHNRAMYTPLVVSSLALAVSAHGVADRREGAHIARDVTYAAAALTGLIGTGFHAYNVANQPGGITWDSLFYRAPLGAPSAILLSGLLGFMAERVRAGDPGQEMRFLGFPTGRFTAAITSAGLLGTMAEAGLFHFRGAYHNPFMFVPVTIPPAAALIMGEIAFGPVDRSRAFSRWWLRMTAAIGFAGVGFHAYGVHRNMGGWRNWRQNILNGPPLPAPPSFTGLALAGLAALNLIEGHPDA